MCELCDGLHAEDRKKMIHGKMEQMLSKSAPAPGSDAPRYFTMSELYGPFPCETKGCDNTIAWTIKLTAEENNSLPEPSGGEAASYINKNKIGIALCEKCLKKEKH